MPQTTRWCVKRWEWRLANGDAEPVATCDEISALLLIYSHSLTLSYILTYTDAYAHCQILDHLSGNVAIYDVSARSSFVSSSALVRSSNDHQTSFVCRLSLPFDYVDVGFQISFHPYSFSVLCDSMLFNFQFQFDLKFEFVMWLLRWLGGDSALN